jgi:hypothetical protein
MQYMPKIKAAKALAQFKVADRPAVLYGDIESVGRVQYAYLFTVFDDAKQPILIISSELNSMRSVLGGGSHYLCIFDNAGHSNCGDSDDWADEELFTARALALAYERLPKLQQQPPPAGADPEQQAKP